MKRLFFVIALSAVCVLFSGYAKAVVAHLENFDIVGKVVLLDAVCFNNDATVTSFLDCDNLDFDEGYLYVLGGGGGWYGGNLSGINACTLGSHYPVSGVHCTLSKTFFSSCTNNQYVLVRTTKSNHYWAIKADATCSFIATPEPTGLVPCRSTDAFDSLNGCHSVNPPDITIKEGYIKPNTNRAPPPTHCNAPGHHGRMVVDSVDDIIYVCTPSGWSEH